MKSKILMATLMVLALVFCVATASAAVSVTSSYSSTNPTFGSSSTSASNPNADDASDENVYSPAEVTINNTGTSALNITGITVTAASGFSQIDKKSDGFINISLDDTDLTISGNSSEAITLKGRIPASLDAVDSGLNAAAFKVATVMLTFSDGSTVSFDAYMQRENRLDLKKLSIEKDGKKTSYNNGDNVKKIYLGDSLLLSVSMKSLYSSNDDVSIDNIDTILDIENDDSIDYEDPDSEDLSAGKEKTVEATIDVTSDAEDSDHDLTVSVDGEDEFGARHGEKITVTLQVDQKTHDIRISSSSLAVSSMGCSRGSDTVQFQLENFGKEDEDAVSAYVTNSDLSINYEQTKISIDSGDNTPTKTVSFTVPSTLKAGTYLIAVDAYYSGTKSTGVHADQQYLELVVSDCGVTTQPVTPAQPATPAANNTVVVVEPTVNPVVPQDVLDEFGGADTSDVTETTETPFMQSTGFIVLLVVGILVVLGAEGALIYFFMKK